jgi:hypothetical protein
LPQHNTLRFSSVARLKLSVNPSITENSYLPFNMTDSQVGKFQHSKQSAQRDTDIISLHVALEFKFDFLFTIPYGSAAMA